MHTMTPPVDRDARIEGLVAERERLSAHAAEFIERYNAFDRERFAAAERIQQQREILGLGQMLESGITTSEGFLSGPALDSAREHAEAILERSAAAAQTMQPGSTTTEAGTGIGFWRGSSEHDGRTRAAIPRDARAHGGDAISSLFENAELDALVSGYAGGARAWVNYILVERLTPAESADSWHFDKIFDQVKVMIPLTRVTKAQGPLRYKAGTHRRPAKIDPFLHLAFAHGPSEGLDYAYPPEPLVNRLGAETVYGTGEPGDAIVFDTLGIHAGSRCVEGERLAIVLAYNIATPKNDALYGLLFPEKAA